MMRPTAIGTYRRPHARLLAALLGALLTLGLFAGSGTASASVAPHTVVPAYNIGWPQPPTPLEVSSNGGNPLCSFGDPSAGYGGWGGTFYCNSNVAEPMPNGYYEAFVIGTDHSVWTIWSSSSGLSSWHSMGGQCLDPDTNNANQYTGEDVGIAWTNPNNGWNWVIECVGTDGGLWYRERSGSASGSWTGWQDWYTTS